MRFRPYLRLPKLDVRMALALLPIACCALLLGVLMAEATAVGTNGLPLKTVMDVMKTSSWTSTKETGFPTPCSSNHVHQLTSMKQKQAAWLNHHPLLMRISRMDFDGVPGELLTNAYWHMMKAVTHHKYHPDSLAKQTA